jgi:hypothetical protein
MASGKKRPFDVDAWIQFHLLRLAAFHSETTKADLAVLAEIIQRYHGDYGNGWASHEHLGNMTGVSKASVIRAKKNLAQLGFVAVVSEGRRGSATVYKPNFDLVSRKGSTDDTLTFGNTDDTETGQQGCTPDTGTPDYGGTDGTPSCLPVPAYQAELRDRQDVEAAAPTAPLADALEGTAAGTAGFEEFYESYGMNAADTRDKARKAYDKLAPSPALHRTIVEAAVAWRLGYDLCERDLEFRKRPSTWLAGKHWLEQPPRPRADRHRKQPAPVVVRRDMTITHVESGENRADVTVLFNDLEPGDAPTAVLRFWNEDEYMALQEAAGSELVGSRLLVDFSGGDDTDDDEGTPEIRTFRRHPDQRATAAI